MKTQLKMTNSKHKLALILGIFIFSLFTLNTFISAYNYEYINVSTRVNITNARPEIDSVRIDTNVLLDAGTFKSVKCNVSLHDWNGYADIVTVNATFWDNNTVNYTSPDDNNSHYTNSSCANVSQSGYYANYTCSFNVWYYANNGTNWVCNATVIDGYNFTESAFNISSIQPYYALNVTTPIDFGNMAVGDYKYNITANVTNYGNRNVNISVYGYGVTPGDGIAMRCAIRNISLSNLKFSINASNVWSELTEIGNQSIYNTSITGLNVIKRTSDTGVEAQNTTYWSLYVSPLDNPFGVCNGTVVFNANIG